jgi:hypothetical protein
VPDQRQFDRHDEELAGAVGEDMAVQRGFLDAIGNPNYLRQCAYLSARRLRENLAAQDLELTGEDIRSIDELAPDRAA